MATWTRAQEAVFRKLHAERETALAEHTQELNKVLDDYNPDTYELTHYCIERATELRKALEPYDTSLPEFES